MNLENLRKLLGPLAPEQLRATLHSAGATGRPRNPFENLAVPGNDAPLGAEFIEQWVVPFYMQRLSALDATSYAAFVAAARRITPKIVTQLLGDFNWRTRLTGAYFAAINNYQQFTDAIGRLLLKSEVCYAADGYCLALLLFGTAEAKDYLQQYLHYYLRRPDLWFDQNDALAALTLLDTAAAAEFAEAWLKFVADKPNWNLQRTTEQLQACAAVIRRMRLDLGH